MPSIEAIRTQVDAFLRQHNTGSTKSQDAFAPWYLSQHFHLPAQEAIAQSSDANFDGGIDAYHLERRAGAAAVLTVLQAKLSEQDRYVQKGVDDLRRAVEIVSAILLVGPTEMVDEHRVVRNLRRDLIALPEAERSALEVRFMLIHLLKDQELWLSRPAVQKAKEDFFRAVGDSHLGGRATITFQGPAQMLNGEAIPHLADPIPIRFQGVSLAPGTDKALFGLGHLADLVNLHEKYHAALFEKNVRMYLARPAARTKSAANHIKSSLERICDGKMPAPHFAMTHNGVTLTVPRVTGPEEGKLTLEPAQGGVFVLRAFGTNEVML